MSQLTSITSDLNEGNYFSPENSTKYFGSSQFKAFTSCPAAAMAELRGEYRQEKSIALLVGSYVDEYFSGTLDVFRAKNPDIFTKSGTLKSDYVQAENIIRRIERDPMLMSFMNGDCYRVEKDEKVGYFFKNGAGEYRDGSEDLLEVGGTYIEPSQKQVIMTGEIESVPVKIKIDSYHPGKCIVDLKIMKDFNLIWVDGEGKIPFVEAWRYDLQLGLYQDVVKQNTGLTLPVFIAAATKEKPEPDIAIISIPQETLDIALAEIKSSIIRFAEIKAGPEEPTRCERCNWCRSTKVLTEIVDYRELG